MSARAGAGVTRQGETRALTGAAAICCVWSAFAALACSTVAVPVEFQHAPPTPQWEFEEVFTVGIGPGSIASLGFTPDNGLLAVDGQRGRIFRFDPMGQPTGQLGRRGDGPGEFGLPLHVAVAESGTIFVLDVAWSRILRFLPNGDLDDWWQLEIAGMVDDLTIVDGQVLTRISPNLIGGVGLQILPPIRIVAWDQEFTDQRLVWEFEGLAPWPEADEPPGSPSDVPPLLSPPLFSPKAVWGRVSGNRIAFGRTDEYSLTIVDPGGEQIGSLTRETAPVAVTEEYEEAVRSWVSSLGDEQLMSSMRFAEFFPKVFGVLEGPADTTIVVRPGDVIGKSLVAQWDVFDAADDYLGTVEPPAGFTLFAAKGFLVAGTQKDPEESVVRVLRVRVR